MPRTSGTWDADSPQPGAYSLVDASMLKVYPSTNGPALTTPVLNRNGNGDYSLNLTGAGTVICVADFSGLLLRIPSQPYAPGEGFQFKGIATTGTTIIYRVIGAAISAPSVVIRSVIFWNQVPPGYGQNANGILVQYPPLLPYTMPTAVNGANQNYAIDIAVNPAYEFFSSYTEQVVFSGGGGGVLANGVVANRLIEFTVTLAAGTTLAMYGISMHYKYNFA